MFIGLRCNAIAVRSNRNGGDGEIEKVTVCMRDSSASIHPESLAHHSVRISPLVVIPAHHLHFYDARVLSDGCCSSLSCVEAVDDERHGRSPCRLPCSSLENSPSPEAFCCPLDNLNAIGRRCSRYRHCS